jgi:hypothetical protein
MTTRDKLCQCCGLTCGEYPHKRGFIFEGPDNVARAGMLYVCQCCSKLGNEQINVAALRHWEREQQEQGRGWV